MTKITAKKTRRRDGIGQLKLRIRQGTRLWIGSNIAIEFQSVRGDRKAEVLIVAPRSLDISRDQAPSDQRLVDVVNQTTEAA